MRQWLNSQSGFLLYCSLRNTCSCELAAIATANISNPTVGVMCQEMSMSPANVVELHV